MLYLSQLLGTPVEDALGTRIGKITDMLGTGPSPAPGAARAGAGNRSYPRN
jgi:hypothetical protein